MVDLNTYIIEKLHLNKDINYDNTEFKEFCDFLTKLLDEDKVTYTLEINEDDPDNKVVIVIIRDRYLLDKDKAFRYVGEINSVLHSEKINYRSHYPTINKQSGKKVSMTMEFYKEKK